MGGREGGRGEGERVSMHEYATHSQAVLYTCTFSFHSQLSLPHLPEADSAASAPTHTTTRTVHRYMCKHVGRNATLHVMTIYKGPRGVPERELDTV